ncbi:hypothetical protein KRP22_012422 [Phytophthora ramorum]|nr:hypothetical protein KRP22_13180 [Phytophthora ramorum]
MNAILGIISHCKKLRATLYGETELYQEIYTTTARPRPTILQKVVLFDQIAKMFRFLHGLGIMPHDTSLEIDLLKVGQAKMYDFDQSPDVNQF